MSIEMQYQNMLGSNQTPLNNGYQPPQNPAAPQQQLYPLLPQQANKPYEMNNNFVNNHNNGYKPRFPQVSRQYGNALFGNQGLDFDNVSNTQKTAQNSKSDDSDKKSEDDEILANFSNLSIKDNKFDLKTVEKHRELVRFVCEQLASMRKSIEAKDHKMLDKPQTHDRLYPTVTAF